MLEAFVLDGTITLAALCALAVEAAVLAGLAVMRRTPPATAVIANLLSGLFLIIALRAALLKSGEGVVALYLALGGAAHLANVLMRLRRPS